MGSDIESIKRSKKYRNSGPRTRTGCKTCKIRRVKCDETKPECSRCTSTGRKCDGYAISGGSQSFDCDDGGKSGLYGTVSNYPSFGGNVHYLEFYHHHARPLLSTPFDNEFWTRIVLQMASVEPAVRYAVIALASLVKTERGTLKHARAVLTTCSEPNALLQHYDKSIKCLVQRLGNAACPPEVGLVTCLLYICIEYLRGDYMTAFAHLRSGLGILAEQRRRRGISAICTQTEYGKLERGASHSPATALEDKLSPIYMRAVASALMFGQLLEEVIPLPCPSPTSLRHHPITSIFEAQCSCHELRNASLVFIRQVGSSIVQRGCPTPEQVQHQTHLLESQTAWYHSVQHFEKAQTLSEEEEAIVSALYVTYFATYTWTACAASPAQIPFDAHLPHFQSLIAHAKAVLDAASPTTETTTPVPKPTFTFEVSLVPALFHTAIRCRHPLTRRAALALLTNHPIREGLWDAQQCAVVARRIIALEEAELDPSTGWPGEKTRVYATLIGGDMDCEGVFSVVFLPGRWVGLLDENGQQQVMHERLAL